MKLPEHNSRATQAHPQIKVSNTLFPTVATPVKIKNKTLRVVDSEVNSQAN